MGSSWGTTQPLGSQLLRSLGDGLIDFLSNDPERRVVTKSPTIANLDLFFQLPHAYLLLLIRDGRDVAASGMKTFGWGLREAATSWAWGAAEVERFAEQHPGEAVRVVRYEDLVQDPQVALRDVLSFLHLPVDDYDLGELEEIPVRGSSTYFGARRREINWEVLPRPRDFSPIGRWKSWSPSDITYFESIAGEQLARFGYRTPSEQVS